MTLPPFAFGRHLEKEELDRTLNYVDRACSPFRRDSLINEPLLQVPQVPQTARGFYSLSGYAAQRITDLGNDYAPDQSTPPSRNLDVGALYFQQPVARGGHGGYLPSDAVPKTWLNSSALKMLVGYPADGSIFGVTNITNGFINQTQPHLFFIYRDYGDVTPSVAIESTNAAVGFAKP